MKLEWSELNDYKDSVVWICHTNWRKRIILPTRVFMKKESKNSNPSFHKFKKNGKPYAKSTYSYYNQGRENVSTCLSVFTDEMMCKDYFVNKCQEEIDIFNNLINKTNNS